MKGHARIELTNVETGEKKTIDHDNMITNAVAELIKPLGIGYSIMNTIYSQSNNITIDRLFSGLMMFSDTIEEDANIIVPPAGNAMVGKGDDTAYTGVDTSKGSFNVADSGYDENGNLKLVWEFNTSQANGTISCICLCPLEGGSIGVGSPVYGNDCQKEFSIITYKNVQYNNDKSADYMADICIIDANNDKVMRCGNAYNQLYSSSDASVYIKDTQALKCYIERMHLNTVSMLDSKTMRILEYVDIPFKDSVISALPSRSDTTKKKDICYAICNDGQYCYFCLSEKSLIPANGKLYLTKYDISNNETEIIEITNTTGKNIILRKMNNNNVYEPYYSFQLALKVLKGYLFVKTEDNMIYRIKLSDNTDVSPAIIGIAQYSNADWFAQYDDGERIFLRDLTLGCVAVLDSVSNEVSYINTINSLWNDGNVWSRVRICGRPAFVGKVYVNDYYKRFDSSYIQIHCNPLLISTINNLTEPVTKTSSHTMKVTYTLSPSEV